MSMISSFRRTYELGDSQQLILAEVTGARWPYLIDLNSSCCTRSLYGRRVQAWTRHLPFSLLGGSRSRTCLAWWTCMLSSFSHRPFVASLSLRRCCDIALPKTVVTCQVVHCYSVSLCTCSEPVHNSIWMSCTPFQVEISVGIFYILCMKNTDMLLFTTNIDIAHECSLYTGTWRIRSVHILLHMLHMGTAISTVCMQCLYLWYTITYQYFSYIK